METIIQQLGRFLHRIGRLLNFRLVFSGGFYDACVLLRIIMGIHLVGLRLHVYRYLRLGRLGYTFPSIAFLRIHRG